MRSVPVLALLLVPVLASCSLAPQTKRAQAIYDAREKANRSFLTTDAIELAMAIHHAFEQGDYASNYAQLSSDVLSAHYALERVMNYTPENTPTVLAWRGVMYEDTGRVTQAREEYRRSMELRPTFLAATKIVPLHGTFHDADSVVDVCKRTYPTLTEVDKQVALIEVCTKELARLVPKEQLLAWLDPQSAAWYHRELERRAKQALAEQEARRVRKERAEKVAAYVQRCSSTCHDDGVSCQARCSHDSVCNERCERGYNTCVDNCETAARKAFTPAPTKAPVKRLEGEQRSDPSARAASKA